MSTHILLLAFALLSVVIAGSSVIAHSLGALYLAPVLVVVFFAAIAWRASEPEILGRRLWWALSVLGGLTLVAILFSLRQYILGYE